MKPKRPTDLADLTEERIRLFADTKDGNLETLARYLEAGGELHDDLRELVVLHLRGELRFSPGGRRTYAQKVVERGAQQAVRAYQRYYAAVHGSWGSRTRAMKDYLELNLQATPETLKKYLKRAGGTVSKHELKLIDQSRAKALAEIAAEQAAEKKG